MSKGCSEGCDLRHQLRHAAEESALLPKVGIKAFDPFTIAPRRLLKLGAPNHRSNLFAGVARMVDVRLPTTQDDNRHLDVIEITRLYSGNGRARGREEPVGPVAHLLNESISVLREYTLAIGGISRERLLKVRKFEDGGHAAD
jgi:hypothetical protein